MRDRQTDKLVTILNEIFISIYLRLRGLELLRHCRQHRVVRFTRTFAVGAHFLSHVAVNFLSLDCVLIQWNALLVVVLFRIFASNDGVVDDDNRSPFG